jgi:hypothetical protein
MLPQRKSRTFQSFVLRALVPRVLVFGACAAFLAVGQAMAVDAAAQSEAVITEQATLSPSWSMADAASYPGCVPASEWVTGTPAPAVVVVGLSVPGHRKIEFGRAWTLNHNDSPADDVWVLGVCP